MAFFFVQEQNLIQRISKLFFSICKQQILKNSPNCFSSGKTLTINWTKHKPKYIWKMHFHFLNKVFYTQWYKNNLEKTGNEKKRNKPKNFNLLYSRWWWLLIFLSLSNFYWRFSSNMAEKKIYQNIFTVADTIHIFN